MNLALRVLLPFSGGYFLSYLYRTVNAVLAPNIAADIALDAGALGLMTGMYLLAFGSFQLPLGVLLDRFGPRRVEAALLVFAAMGAALFATAEHAGTLILGRALVGLGVSACLMASIKANVQFYPPRRLALVNGIILFAGGLGAVAATQPVQMALGFMDWRGVFWVLSGLTLAMSVVLFVTVPEKSAGASSGSVLSQLRGVADICRNPDFLRVMPATAMTLGSFMAIQGLWAGPWMRDVAGLDGGGIAQALMMMAAGMALGYLLWGVVTDMLARFRIPLLAVALFGMAWYVASLAAMALGVVVIPNLLAASFGFAGASTALCYVVVAQSVPPTMSGRATTSLNLIIFAAAFALQWGLGAVINLWPKVGAGWPAQAHQLALAIPTILSLAAMAWMGPLVGRHWRNR
ncbi:nitrate/nitrite transporter [Magnetospirillum sp. 64-120]|uniref:MFS transporter n=1 Tax=Magnetospirillum sp. 64-120 TaxID=1895778 RepID=UPI00092B1B38|nr:MFS transporter [Magnetospirillum sp. 64-120]OJX80949.1 MAG: MFS transporter [Magnetospirillum sp. 64-120]